MRTPRNTGACRQQTARQENNLCRLDRRRFENVQLPLGQGANHAGLCVPGAFVMRPMMQRVARRQTAKSQQQDGQKADHQRLRPKRGRVHFPLHCASSKQDQRQRQAWICMKFQSGSISLCYQFTGCDSGDSNRLARLATGKPALRRRARPMVSGDSTGHFPARTRRPGPRLESQHLHFANSESARCPT